MSTFLVALLGIWPREPRNPSVRNKIRLVKSDSDSKLYQTFSIEEVACFLVDIIVETEKGYAYLTQYFSAKKAVYGAEVASVIVIPTDNRQASRGTEKGVFVNLFPVFRG